MHLAETFSLGAAPTTKDAQAVSDEIFATFVAQECDKVELVFTKFVSLIASNPTIQTLLPMTPAGELCGVDGKCVDAADDEVFKLTTKAGELSVEREKKTIETEALDPSLIFEQEPSQILDALLPLYLNSCLLRSLQEALASELAARMNAMNNACDNAKELKKVGVSPCRVSVPCKGHAAPCVCMVMAGVIVGRLCSLKLTDLVFLDDLPWCRSIGDDQMVGVWSRHLMLSLLLCLQALSVQYNKQRQAKITQELSEIVGGAAATSG